MLANDQMNIPGRTYDAGLISRMPQILHGAQYTVFGDSNHRNLAVKGFHASPVFMESLHRSGVRHLAVEIPKEWQGVIDNFQRGSIDRQQLYKELLEKGVASGLIDPVHRAPDYKENALRLQTISESIEQAKKYGIRVSAVDSVDYYRGLDDPQLRERLSHDGDVAANIRHASRGDKTAVLYGALHDGIAPALGPDTRTINIYATQTEQISFASQGKNPPQITSILAEGRSYFSASVPAKLDHTLGLAFMQTQNPDDVNQELYGLAFVQELQATRTSGVNWNLTLAAPEFLTPTRTPPQPQPSPARQRH